MDRGHCRGQRASFCLFGDKTDLVILPCSADHLAEDTAVLVSDPGQVWRRDWAFKGMVGGGREGVLPSPQMLRSEGPAWPGVPGHGRWGEGRPGRYAHLPALPSFVPADRSAGRPVRTKHLCSPGWSHIWDTLPWRWGSRRRLGGSQGAGQGNEQPEAWGPLPTWPRAASVSSPGCLASPGREGSGVRARSGLGAGASPARWLRGLLSVCDPPSFESAHGRQQLWSAS